MQKIIIILFLCACISTVNFAQNNTVVQDFSPAQYLGFSDNTSGQNFKKSDIQLLQAGTTDDGKRKQAKKLRDAGIGLFIASLVGPIVGSSIAVSSLAVTDNQQGVDALLGIGYTIIGLTAPLLVPGIVMWIIGDLRYEGIFE